MRPMVLMPRGADSKAITVVVANGEVVCGQVALALLRGAERVVCCDGAVDKLLVAGVDRVVDAVVGDCDSISPESRLRYADVIHKVDNQDSNDLIKALEYCLQRGWRKVVVVGASGGRDDHFLSNIGVLIEWHERMEISVVSRFGVFDVVDSPAWFESCEGQQVSLFAFDPSVRIRVEGLKYLPPDDHLRELWSGQSNESLGDRFCVDCNGMVLVYRVF